MQAGAAPEPNTSTFRLTVGEPISPNSHRLLNLSLRFSAEPLFREKLTIDISRSVVLHWQCRPDYLYQIVSVINSPAADGSPFKFALSKFRENIQITAFGNNNGLWVVLTGPSVVGQIQATLNQNKPFLDKLVQDKSSLRAQVQSNEQPRAVLHAIKTHDFKPLLEGLALKVSAHTFLLSEFLTYINLDQTGPWNYLLSKLNSINFEVDLGDKLPAKLFQLFTDLKDKGLGKYFELQDAVLDKYGEYLDDQLQLFINLQGVAMLEVVTGVRGADLIKGFTHFAAQQMQD